MPAGIINILFWKIECRIHTCKQLNKPAQMSSTTRCGVCLEECGENNIARTECGHTTHLNCFVQVLSTSDNCIYCRKKLNLKKPIVKDPFIERHSMWIQSPHFDLGNTILTAFITILVYGALVYTIIHWFIIRD
jgi:hypothetical protein